MTDAPIGLARFLPVPPDEAELMAHLASVIDPELGVGIVDLGLVYEAYVEDGVAHVRMTTTTPACPIGAFLEDQIRRELFRVNGVVDVEVELTFDPPWSPAMMSDRAKELLGWSR